MSSQSPRHAAARTYAAANIPVFPCLRGSKKPACSNGFRDATTDLAIIDAWWSQDDYNVALCPHDAGWAVIDIERTGEAAWQTYCGENTIEVCTYAVQTPNGGRHLYFEGELPSTVRKLVPKEPIDTRGVGGYVLVPPSIVEGRTYEVLNDADIARLPGCIKDSLGQPSPIVEATGTEPDLAGNIERARSLLVALAERGEIAVEGHGGDNRTYETCSRILELGLSPRVALDLLLEHWNPHCQPPWSEDELELKVENAARYMQNAIGAYAVPNPSDVFAETLAQLSTEKLPPVERSRFYFEDDREQDETPDTQWIIANMIPDQATVLLLGPSGHFKSFVAQHILMSLAAGHKGAFAGLRSGPTFYGAHEGRREIKKARKNAWKEANGLAGVELPFYVARAPLVADEDQCNEFREAIRARLRQHSAKIAGIVLDTVAKCMLGLNENDARDIGKFVAFCDSLRDEFECPAIALHHTGKDDARGARGSSALQAGFDTTLLCKRVENSRAVSLRVMQHKDAEEPEAPWTFEARKVGASLVLAPISAAEYASAIGRDDPFDARKVGRALFDMGATNGRTVTTEALASQLGLTDKNTSTVLRKLAATKLRAYSDGAGKDLVWFMTDQAQDQ